MKTKLTPYWLYLLSEEKPSYEITGKYLFFNEAKEKLIDIAKNEIEHHEFHKAKVNLHLLKGQIEHVLCLYYKDDSRKNELAERNRKEYGVKYRYWKSDIATLKGQYSKEFLSKLGGSDRHYFRKNKQKKTMKGLRRINNPNRKHGRYSSKKIIGIILSIAFVCFIFGGLIFFYVVVPFTIDTDQLESEIFELINKERLNHGLPILNVDSKLELIAKEWSDELAEDRKLTHGDFDQRIASIGYSHYSCGEIIALHDSWSLNLAQKFVDMWKKSPGHYQIIMTASHGFMGVGVSKNMLAVYGVVDFRFN